MSLDLANDWAMIDDLVSVTYFVKTGEGAYATGATVNNACRRAVTTNDVIVDPALLQKDSTILHVWKNQLSGIVPKLGDYWVDSGSVKWVVKHITPCDQDAGGYQRYQLISTKFITP